jgi:hypothetical protein
VITFRVVWLRYKSTGRLSLPQEGADRLALMAFPWLREKSTIGWPGEGDDAAMISMASPANEFISRYQPWQDGHMACFTENDSATTRR